MPRHNAILKHSPLTTEQRAWVEANMRIVWSVIGQDRHRSLIARHGRDEVTQHGFFVMCRAVQTYKTGGGATLATHVRAAVEWQMIGLYSRGAMGFLAQIVNDDDPEQALAIFGATTDPDAIEAEDIRERVRNILCALRPREREAVELYYGLNEPAMNQDGAAVRMGVSRQRVHSLLSESLVKLWRASLGRTAVA